MLCQTISFSDPQARSLREFSALGTRRVTIATTNLKLRPIPEYNTLAFPTLKPYQTGVFTSRHEKYLLRFACYIKCLLFSTRWQKKEETEDRKIIHIKKTHKRVSGYISFDFLGRTQFFLLEQQSIKAKKLQKLKITKMTRYIHGL